MLEMGLDSMVQASTISITVALTAAEAFHGFLPYKNVPWCIGHEGSRQRSGQSVQAVYPWCREHAIDPHQISFQCFPRVRLHIVVLVMIVNHAGRSRPSFCLLASHSFDPPSRSI